MTTSMPNPTTSGSTVHPRPPRPSSRHGFEIAIICALVLEADAVEASFDHFWDEDNGPPYDKATGDPNAYTTGVIGRHNVVLAHLGGMGKVSAAAAAGSIRTSFPNIRLAIVVGICGAIPHTSDGQEIVLGDVIISNGVVQYDFGRRLPDRFVRKAMLEDSLGRSPTEIRALLNKLNGRRGRQGLQQKTILHLIALKDEAGLAATYPGVTFDRLFDPTYQHLNGEKACQDAGCSGTLIPRLRLQSNSDKTPVVHFGLIASGDTVMKSGKDRDCVAESEQVIAFEMEGAGIWDSFPCLVIKGVCDYADSHKSKLWQRYASAAAASCMKAFLDYWIPSRTIVQSAPLGGLSNPISPDNVPQRPEPFSTIPFPLDPDFVERTSITTWLHDNADRPGTRAAIVGLGGIGKSQLAVQYAYQARRRSPNTFVFWVHASSRARFDEAYRNMADRLQLPERHNREVDVVRLVYTWLSDENNGPWLMILDNADDIDMFYPRNHARGTAGTSTQRPLASLLPHSNNGRMLITSRSRDVAERLTGSYWHVYSVEPMDEEQAIQLLKTKLRDTYDEAAAAPLTRALEYMPLAITQATAYILRQWPRSSPSVYLKEFQKGEKKRGSLLNKDMGDLRRDAEAANSVVTTWQITFEQIQRERPSAAHLLSFMSFFNPQGIPEWILRSYQQMIQKRQTTQRKDPLGLLQVEGSYDDSDALDELNDDLTTLRAYSLIKATTQDIFEIHALVQLCLRVWLSSAKDIRKWRQEFLQVMSNEYPTGEYENWGKCQQLEPHISQLLQTEPADENASERARLFTNIGWYEWRIGRYESAETLLSQSYRIREKMFGKDHPDTLLSLSILANTLRFQGNNEKSEQMHRWTLERREKTLGKNHPDTFTSLSNLAKTLQDQGKYTEAEQIHRQTLESREKILGKDHPDTLSSLNDLARTLQDQGKYEEAEQIHRQTLESREKTLGKDHPDTLLSLNNLAGTLGNQRKYEESEQIYRQGLDSLEKTLGKDHPDTLSSLNNLAGTLQDQGKYEEAEQIHRQTLDSREKILGKDHPDTLITLNNLAITLQDQGKYEEAEQMHRQALNSLEKTLGKDHPHTLSSLNNLAGTLSDQGKYEEAEQIHRQTLDSREKTLGKNHPQTLRSCYWLAYLCQQQEREEEADAFYNTAIAGYTETLGPAHPDTVACQTSYDVLRNQMNKQPS